MKGKYVFIGVLALIGYIIITSLISSTEAVWLQTRFFGLLSFAALFLVVLLGELRMLHVSKAKFKFFKYHKPLGIFALSMVFLHFIASFLDNYKWGVYLSVTDYLGFTFRDNWLTYLSFGMLATYLMILIGATSATKSIQKIGFKRWKVVHYLSYISFIFAYVHSVNLGTDIKVSVLSPLLSVIIPTSFFFIIGLLLTRVSLKFQLLKEQQEVTLAATLIVILLVGGVFIFSIVGQDQQIESQLESKLVSLQQADLEVQSQVSSLQSTLLDEQLATKG